MNTETIAFALTATASNVNIYTANFADCELELNEDKDSITIIDEFSNSETWEKDSDGNWIFTEGTNGQAPTANWPENYHAFVEAAIAAL